MIKKLLFCGAAVMALASCTGGTEEPTTTQTLYNVNLLVKSPEGNFYTTTGNFNLKFRLATNTCEFGWSDILLGNNTVKGVTNPLPLNYGVTEIGGLYEMMADGNNSAESNSTLTNLYAEFGTSYYTLDGGPLGYEKINNILVLDMTVDGYLVRSFQPKAYYHGKTSSRFVYQGQTNSYATDETIFAVDMDTKNMKATVYICNAKFAEPMPLQQQLKLENLDLRWNNSGYQIIGKNVVPQRKEADGFVPFPSFTFDNFSLQTVPPRGYVAGFNGKILTDIDIDFLVAGVYNGHFEGSYLMIPADDEKI